MFSVSSWLVNLEETRYPVATEVDGLDVNICIILHIRVRVEATVVVPVGKDDRDETARDWLRKRNVHDVLVLEVNEGTESESESFELAWAHVWVSKSIHVEALAEFHQVDVFVRHDLLEVDFVSLRHK